MVIHERSQGIPRLVSVISHNALISGFALNQRPITASLVREVCEDFDLRSAAGMAMVPPFPPTAATSEPAQPQGLQRDIFGGVPRPKRRYSFF